MRRRRRSSTFVTELVATGAVDLGPINSHQLPIADGARGFEEVFDICEAACRGLLDDWVARLAER